MMARVASLALLVSLWAAPALADIEGSVTLVSDYIDKGMSQSDGNAAFQAGLTWTHETGLFLAVDGSTVDFNDSTNAELNMIGGYQWEWEQWAVVAGISRTHYAGAPKGAGLDLWEFALAGSLDLETHQWEAEMVYSPDDGGAGDALYHRIAVTIPFAERFAISPHLGHQWYDRKDLGGPNFWEWGAELSYALAPATFGIAYTDTSLKNEDGCKCGGRVAAFVTVSFP